MHKNKLEMKKVLKNLREEINALCKLNSEQAPPGEYFFAFGDKQFEDGKKQIGIAENNLLLSVGTGMYGTQKGIDEFWAFQNERAKRIQEQISPLAFFYYEYGNHDGEYSAYGEAWEFTRELYPNFDFDDKNNANVIVSIREEWEQLNF